MDYIQQALEKARAARQQGGAQPATGVAGAARPAAKPADGGLPGKINYTSTRQVQRPARELAGRRLVAADSNDRAAEPYRQLRTQVLRQLRQNNWQTLAITSPNSNAGKTLTAANLAIALSQEVNQTVLLADLDLRNPSVASTFGIEVKQGLVDHLEGKVEVADILVNPGLERLVILPGRPGSGYRSELLSSPAMTTLLTDLTTRYTDRIILFDLPALLDDDDAMVFTPYANATLLVVEDGVTSREELEKSLQLLQGTQLLGTVLNKVRS